MKCISALVLVLHVGVCTGFAQTELRPPDTTRTEKLSDLIDEALTANPEIAAGIHNMSAAGFLVPQAGSLPDPQLNFKLMEIPGTNFREATYANVEFMQLVPFPSKLTARTALAELLAEHAHHEHMEKVVSILSDLKSDLAELWFARESQIINEANRRLVDGILQAAKTMYAVGKASQMEVLKTQIESTRLEAEAAEIQERIASAESLVRTILNRPGAAPIGFYALEDTLPVAPSLDQLLRAAAIDRPMLIHDSLNVVEKQMNVDLMKKEYLPDFTFSLEYVRMPVLMENRWSVLAGITLPFAPWTLAKASSRVQEAEAEQSMLSSVYTASKNMVAGKIRSNYASLKAFTKRLRYYRENILPLASHSLDLLLSDYETGKTSYLMVIDGYRMYNEMKLDLAMARMKYQQTIADLERDTGVLDLRSIAPVDEEIKK